MRLVLVAAALLLPGCSTLRKADTAVEELTTSSQQLKVANLQIMTATNQLTAMQANLAETTREMARISAKLDQTNAYLAGAKPVGSEAGPSVIDRSAQSGDTLRR